MQDSESIKLLKRYQDGDETAADALFERYTNRLVALARSRISPTLRRRVDADDIVQSVYRSFFDRAQQNRFTVEHNGQLWSLLAAITVNKIRDQAKFHSAGKRNLSAEQSISASQRVFGIQPVNFSHTPDGKDLAALNEVLDHILSQLESRQRQILQLFLENKSHEEIAQEIRRSPRTVRRELQNIESTLQQRLDSL